MSSLFALPVGWPLRSRFAIVKSNQLVPLSQFLLQLFELPLPWIFSLLPIGQGRLAAGEKLIAPAIQRLFGNSKATRQNRRLTLSAAHSRQRDWQGAAGHLEKYLSYTKTISDRVPASGQLRARHEAVVKQLDRLNRFAGMTNKPAPAIKTEQFGVDTLPHTVAIDKQGNVKAILLSGKKNETAMEAIVKGLLGIE